MTVFGSSSTPLSFGAEGDRTASRADNPCSIASAIRPAARSGVMRATMLFVPSAPNRFARPSAGLVDAYKAYLKVERDRVIRAGDEAGLKNVSAQVDHYLKTVEKWEKIVAATKRDRKAYSEALHREIFSKLNLQ